MLSGLVTQHNLVPLALVAAWFAPLAVWTVRLFCRTLGRGGRRW